MALLDHFRRRAVRVVSDPVSPGALIDEQAFHLAEQCVRDYSQLRAGDGIDVLLADPTFTAALDRACWEAYPRALAMMGTIAEAALRPYAGDNARAVLLGLIAMILDHFDRRPVPRATSDLEWGSARADLERSLNDLLRAQPRTVEEVARDHSSFYLAIMPLHPKLGADNFPALTNQLKLALAQAQEAFVQRVNLPTLANELAGRVPTVEAHEASSAPA